VAALAAARTATAGRGGRGVELPSIVERAHRGDRPGRRVTGQAAPQHPPAVATVTQLETTAGNPAALVIDQAGGGRGVELLPIVESAHRSAGGPDRNRGQTRGPGDGPGRRRNIRRRRPRRGAAADRRHFPPWSIAPPAGAAKIPRRRPGRGVKLLPIVGTSRPGDRPGRGGGRADRPG
jgi:hypothetical protein